MKKLIKMIIAVYLKFLVVQMNMQLASIPWLIGMIIAVKPPALRKSHKWMKSYFAANATTKEMYLLFIKTTIAYHGFLILSIAQEEKD